MEPVSRRRITQHAVGRGNGDIFCDSIAALLLFVAQKIIENKRPDNHCVLRRPDHAAFQSLPPNYGM